MPRRAVGKTNRTRAGSATKRSALGKPADKQSMLTSVFWRLERLERQVKTLSELVRDHAEDADRLVRIVGEDHNALRQELLRDHQARVRARKRARGLPHG